MIAFLHGTLAEKTPSVATLDVGGVGYEVLISLSTYDRLPATGSACKLLTYHHIREDAQILFGFMQAEEKAMFERLIGVNGVGPKMALSVLSGLTVSELTMAIADNNIKRISAVVTYGRPRWVAMYMGDPPRKIVTRYMKRLTGHGARVDYHAHYHMNVATEPQLKRFMAKVGNAMARFA